ncbi:diguanylate cyclase (GGDEF) domain-containing protein [Fulvimarina manganoxydans]|uniref:Diguanylate cyclase (GGDEF) domain-containing protein n=1 Tax=Fulvimarina manganoxydans TaxID=937218 RepID=A0A1W2E889_9HYPH|nr:sensor domain-containing diguanylate cyclase [Fulvimarina manganoxydans]SMD05875.1 diguanylate cyclase (GGDEF) domain-containing protein [Fulvimarina manganoxydans]
MTNALATTLKRYAPEEADEIAKGVFDLAPVPLWLEDYSGVKRLLDRCRAEGVTDLKRHLLEHPELVEEAAGSIRLLAVNAKTLELFEAESFDTLQENLSSVFSGDMFQTHAGELVQLFEGRNGFESLAINYTLSGRRLDVQVKARILPKGQEDWSRLLISTEDVTEREEAVRGLASSESFSRGLFEHSPVSLWVEDFSAVKTLIDDVRLRGVTDFRTFVDVHPEFVERCMSEIRVIDINQHTLDLFAAPDKATLLAHLSDVFRDDMTPHFKEQLIDLWEGKLFHSREVVNYALGGEMLHVHMQFSVFPGHERDWSLVQVALTDITARKKAEAYLEYLGKHDILTKLNNRSYFDDELNRLERRGPMPVTIIAADLNGLKDTNDTLGHAAGDALLRRAGEVLREAVQRPATAARIGGDEFVVILPAAGEAEGRSMMTAIEELVEVNNQFYGGGHLSLSMGLATVGDGERLEDTVKRADAQMYEAKRAYYLEPKHERRRNRTTPRV